MHLFTFNQQIIDPQSKLTLVYLTYTIKAQTHLEAFTKWCAIPKIQDCSMQQMGNLNITVQSIKEN